MFKLVRSVVKKLKIHISPNVLKFIENIKGRMKQQLSINYQNIKLLNSIKSIENWILALFQMQNIGLN
jgi:uncharacterized protein YdhG (YjbR/CyaY superfamily)